MLNTNVTGENKPVKKKQWFANLEVSELDVLLDSAQSQNTKYNSSFAVSVYKGTGKCEKKNVHYKKMLGLNTKISIKLYEIYGKFKLYYWSQNGPSTKMLKNHFMNKVTRNLTTTYEHFMLRPETKKTKNTESQHYCVWGAELNDILTSLLTTKV